MIGYDTDASDLRETGWGVVFAGHADPAIRAALEPLLDLRRDQAEGRYKELRYEAGESKHAFLSRHGASAGPVAPEILPYYLLLVGGPDQLPFQFQWDLSVQYAVGRLHLDTPEDYAAYARSAVRGEQMAQPLRAAFFGPKHPDDPHTDLLGRHLLVPLSEWATAQSRWDVLTLVGVDANKARLSELLHDDDRPALVLLAGHGLVFGASDPRQNEYQGALVSQEWPGPRLWSKPIPPDFFFSADDLAPELNLTGMIWFHLGSFSAGMHVPDEHVRRRYPSDLGLPGKPFTSRLGRRLLALPEGGALAMVGFAGPMWSYADQVDSVVTLPVVYKEVMSGLERGLPLGAAIESLSERYAELATELVREQEEIRFGKTSDPQRLTMLWTARNDARSLVVLGDPAVRLNVIQRDRRAVKQAVKVGGSRSQSRVGEQPELQAELELGMLHVPTLLYPHLSAERHPLGTLRINNASHDWTLRAHVHVEIKGYSAVHEEEVAVAPRSEVVRNLLPPLLPDAVRRLHRQVKASLDARVIEHETGREVLVDTRPVWLTEATTAVIAVRNPATGGWQDLVPYLGLFITPSDPAVTDILHAAGVRPSIRTKDSRAEAGRTQMQVQAIFQELYRRVGLEHERGALDRHTNETVTLELRRVPRRVVADRRGNMLELALLLASLLEAGSFNPAVVLVPGAAMVAWQDDDQWHYIDVATALSFDEAHRRGESLVRRHNEARVQPGAFPAFVRHSVRDMRAAGILPLEPGALNGLL